MAQPSVASFFNTRKRLAENDIFTAKSKVSLLESNNESKPEEKSLQTLDTELQNLKNRILRKKASMTATDGKNKIQPKVVETTKTRKDEESKNAQQQKVVKFFKKGLLSPKNCKTPPKKIEEQQDPEVKNLKEKVRKELNFEEVKSKITRGSKLKELKASISRLNELEKTRKAHEEARKKLEMAHKDEKETKKELKEFKTIDVEILMSPTRNNREVKQFPVTPNKHRLMSPKNATPEKILFSPSKNTNNLMKSQAAYDKYSSLIEKSALPLPFKYRNLIELFKAVDSVCAMFFNRKECITFKKLKTAVQRMVRRSFTLDHLAQIKNVYPEAYILSQNKMRNYGSVSKTDYFQLVIIPKVDKIESDQTEVTEESILKKAEVSALNPQLLIQRSSKFQNLLLKRVINEHDKFLKSLSPPLIINKSQIKRWHPEFDLENCSDIEKASLPEPPHIEKYSSAKDILSTARNLFGDEKNNILTTESSILNDDIKDEKDTKTTLIGEDSKNIIKNKCSNINEQKAPDETSSTLLKGIPKSLLEKIRAKQTMKTKETMLRHNTQHQEIVQFNRLPDLARHLRNVFVSEKKGILTLDLVIVKIQNSLRVNLTAKEIEVHLKLLSKECPSYLQFHEIRNNVYVKLHKESNITEIINHLQQKSAKRINI